ncbi:MAG: ankyrin repeat domain-containing protein [Rickettsiales bacterium]|nr:ankyrin repeat domain-containing protein [Rickettsiales bacterium]
MFKKIASFIIFTFALSSVAHAAAVDIEEADKILKKHTEAVCELKEKKYDESKGVCAAKNAGGIIEQVTGAVTDNNLLSTLGGAIPGADGLLGSGGDQENQNESDENVIAQNLIDEGAKACEFLSEEYVNRELGPKFTPNITCTNDRSEIVTRENGFTKIMHCTLADGSGQIRQMFACEQNTANVEQVISSNTPKEEKPVSEQMIDAVFAKQFEEAKNLITEHPDIIDYQDSARGTALFIAARHCNMDFINFLIDNGADVNSKGTYGFSAIREAAYYECKDAVVKLKEKGARLDDKDSWGRSVCAQAKANQVRADIMKELGC